MEALLRSRKVDLASTGLPVRRAGNFTQAGEGVKKSCHALRRGGAVNLGVFVAVTDNWVIFNLVRLHGDGSAELEKKEEE